MFSQLYRLRVWITHWLTLAGYFPATKHPPAWRTLFASLFFVPSATGKSLTERIETSSAAGKLVFHVFAALAEFERNVIRERTHAGLAAARARGRKGGRKPALDEKQIREIKALLRDPEIQVSDVAKRYGVSRATVYKHVGPVTPKKRE